MKKFGVPFCVAGATLLLSATMNESVNDRYAVGGVMLVIGLLTVIFTKR